MFSWRRLQTYLLPAEKKKVPAVKHENKLQQTPNDWTSARESTSRPAFQDDSRSWIAHLRVWKQVICIRKNDSNNVYKCSLGTRRIYWTVTRRRSALCNLTLHRCEQSGCAFVCFFFAMYITSLLTTHCAGDKIKALARLWFGNWKRSPRHQQTIQTEAIFLRLFRFIWLISHLPGFVSDAENTALYHPCSGLTPTASAAPRSQSLTRGLSPAAQLHIAHSS